MTLLAWAIIAVILIAAVALALMSTPKTPQPPEPDFEVPTTEIGTKIGVLWGKRRLQKPIVVWYGDVKLKKVKVDTGGKK